MAGRYDHIDFTPPAGVREEAAKGLAWRREHGRGGTAVGVARARDLSNGTKISPQTARRMKAFFDRHQVNVGKTGWSPGEQGFPSNARIAWALWGSSEGWAWSKKLVRQMNAADEQAKRSLRSFLEERRRLLYAVATRIGSTVGQLRATMTDGEATRWASYLKNTEGR